MAAVGIWGPMGWGQYSSLYRIRAGFEATNNYAPARTRHKYLDLHEGTVIARAEAAHIIMNGHYIFRHIITADDFLLGDNPNSPVAMHPDHVGQPVYASRIDFSEELPSAYDKGPFVMRFGDTGVGIGLIAVLNQVEVVPAGSHETEASIAPVSPVPNQLINTTV